MTLQPQFYILRHFSQQVYIFSTQYGHGGTLNQPISQALKQPVNLSTSQSNNQPISQSLNQSLKHSINQSFNQSIKQSVNQLVNHSTNHSSTQSINRSTSQSINHSTNHSSNQSITAFGINASSWWIVAQSGILMHSNTISSSIYCDWLKINEMITT